MRSNETWSTLRHVVTTELRLAFRGLVLPAAAAVLALLAIAACLVSTMRTRNEAVLRQTQQESVRKLWDAQPDRHPHRVSHYGYLAFRPLLPMHDFDPGVDLFAGTSLYLEPHRRNTVALADVAADGGLLRFGSITPALVLQLLAPLLIFCLAHHLVSGERESSRWRLILTQGASPVTVAAGKTAAAVITSLLAVTPAALIAAGFIASRAQVPLDGGRTLAIAAAYLLFIAGCATTAVLVSILHRSAPAALATLLALWMGIWILMPRAAMYLAETRHPAMSRAQLETDLSNELRQIGDSHDPGDPFFARLRDRYLKQYGVSDVAQLPVNYGGVVMKEAEALTTAAQNRVFERLFAVYREQNALARSFAAINPYLAIRDLSMTLAGSDVTQYVAFQQQAERYRYEMAQWLNHLHATKIHYENDRAQKLSRESWHGFPPFRFEPPPLDRQSLLMPGLALLAWLALSSSAVLALSRTTR